MADTDTAKPSFGAKALVGMCALSLVGCAVFFFLFISSAEKEALDALSKGQRLIINAKTGEISGFQAGSASPTATTEPADERPAFDVTDTPPADVTEQPSTPTDATDTLVAEQNEGTDTIRVEPPTAASLSPVDTALLEKTDFGMLPVATATDSPFARYKRPHTVAEERNKMALVVLDLGKRNQTTEQAFTLPVNATLAFSPYSPQLPTWVESARNKGYESWLMQPAEPDTYPAADPGPFAVLLKAEAAANAIAVKRTMGSVTGFAGLVLDHDERFSDDEKQLKALYEQVTDRGLALALAKSPTASNATTWANKEHTRLRVMQRKVDEDLSPAAIRQALQDVMAETTGGACNVVVIEPYPLSLAIAKEWAESLSGKPVSLVPLSACVPS